MRETVEGNLLKGDGRLKLRSIPDIIGFSAHWAWILCVFWSPLYYDEGLSILQEATTLLALEPLWLISLSANVLTIGFLLMLSHFRNPLLSIHVLPWIAATLTPLGTVLMSHPLAVLVGQSTVTFYVVGSALTGIGSGILVVLWGESFASLGSRITINYCVISFIVAAAAFLVFIALPRDTGQILVALLPIISILLYRHFRRSVPPTSRTKNNVHVKERPPYTLIAISLFFGLSFGVMKGLFVPIDADLTWLRNVLNIVAIGGASAAVFLTTSVYKMDFDHMTYQVALPLMAAGFLFVPLSEPWNIIGTGIHQFGYQYFYLILWAIWPVLASRAQVPSGWIAAWGMFSIQVGQLAGSVVSGHLQEFLGSDFDHAILAAVLIFFILLIALFTFGKGSPNTGWGFVKPIEENGTVSDFERTCTHLARQYRLSPREIEVFFLLAKGRNRAHIKEELVVSDETVKSHIKNIYRKTNVHSQQLLIDMIEAELDFESSQTPPQR